MIDLIEEIKAILSGIDCTESSSENGWWETSTGAEFGAQKLNEVIEAINRHGVDHD